MMQRTLIALILVFFYSCSVKEENSSEAIEDEAKIETIFEHKSDLTIDLESSSQGKKYILKMMKTNNQIELLNDKNSSLLEPKIERIKWQGKDYQDWLLYYNVKGSFSFGNNLGGWEKEMHYIRFIDGKTEESYFLAEPYSYQFEEHSISKDTSHPLAATSCFYKYNFQIKKKQNSVVIDQLTGSCLPDLEEGMYFFQNNKWELRKD